MKRRIHQEAPVGQPKKSIVGVSIAAGITIAEESIERLDRGVLNGEGAKARFEMIISFLKQALAVLPSDEIDGAMLVAEGAKRSNKKRAPQ
mgnify:CR=1 FL=1